MNPGELRRQVTIETLTKTPDGAGGYTRAWSPLATVWAKVEPQSGSRFVAQGQDQFRITHKITIRYRADVSAADTRVLYGGAQMAIRSLVDVDDRRAYLVLQCEAATPSSEP